MKITINKINYEKELQNIYKDKKNTYDTLQGCINIICVTDNEEEITRMFLGATRNLLKLSELNTKRIRIKSLIEKEGENNDNN